MARGGPSKTEPKAGAAARNGAKRKPGNRAAKRGGSAQRVEPSLSSSSPPVRSERRKPSRSSNPASRRFRPFAALKRKSSRRRANGKPRPLWRRVAGFALYWGTVAGLWTGLAVLAIVLYYGSKLPSSDQWAIPDRDPVVTLVSVDGDVFAQRGWSTRSAGSALRLDQFSPWLPAAVIAIEDRRFRDHFGVDPRGLARAMVTNLREGRFVQGGSTITQQLAKNVFLSSARSLERKVQEVLLAFWLEREFSKDQILEFYLNRVFFGHGTYGAEAASRRYFGKSASDLTLMEAAILAGSLRAPSRLNPESHPRDAAARVRVVLAAMRETGVIDADTERDALTTPPDEAPGFRQGAMPWASDAVIRELRQRLPEVTGDVRVETTIDLRAQEAAAIVLQDAVASASTKGADAGAVVVMDGAGAVRATVGGTDYRRSQFDRASRAKRQPGSAFKVFTFLAALEKGLSPASLAYDEPVTIDGWSPKNYDDRYRGPVTLEEAFAASLNTVAAQIVAYVGPSAIKRAAERLGVRTELDDNLSLSLGTSEVTPLELTLAYAPFANGGFAPEAHWIERVTDEEGTVLYERALVQDPRVIAPQHVAQMRSMLRAVVERGTGVKARLRAHDAGGKTGTSQQYRDAWFVGTVPGLVATVWIGSDDGQPMRGVTGGSAPAEAWARLMGAVLDGVEPRPRTLDRWVTLPVYGPMPKTRPGSTTGGVAPYAPIGGTARAR